ncbi:voltage-dependent calcium channel gamma-like subunit [Amblyraja radiata]|uniref:voltage-dependent calcium channel gamma-like subunit n=1 Tax=Amblyraja radiata TaxID=386614 RepID=UPI00140230C5|nr:voltage-dependent calcium channel gamma-like subunit [Amblyraja radiata]
MKAAPLLQTNGGTHDHNAAAKVKMFFNKQNEYLLKVQGLLCRKTGRSMLDVFVRSLTILCMAIAIVLSSISVCDGHWLFADTKIFGLWHFCTLQLDHKAECTTEISVAEVNGLYTGLVFIRITTTLAVVLAIFGLEMLITSQLCQDPNARRKWAFGSGLTLLSFSMTSLGMLTFVILLRDFITFTGFSLTFWCEFIATFLFFLSSISGLQIYSMMPVVEDSLASV